MNAYPIKILKAEVISLKTFLEHYRDYPNREDYDDNEKKKWAKHISDARKSLWAVKKALAILKGARKRKVN
jgi:hypothetical protein